METGSAEVIQGEGLCVAVALILPASPEAHGMVGRCAATGAAADGSTGDVKPGFWRRIAAAGRLSGRLLTAFLRS